MFNLCIVYRASLLACFFAIVLVVAASEDASPDDEVPEEGDTTFVAKLQSVRCP
jgi:hypothetical protein